MGLSSNWCHKFALVWGLILNVKRMTMRKNSCYLILPNEQVILLPNKHLLPDAHRSTTPALERRKEFYLLVHRSGDSRQGSDLPLLIKDSGQGFKVYQLNVHKCLL